MADDLQPLPSDMFRDSTDHFHNSNAIGALARGDAHLGQSKPLVILVMALLCIVHYVGKRDRHREWSLILTGTVIGMLRDSASMQQDEQTYKHRRRSDSNI